MRERRKTNGNEMATSTILGRAHQAGVGLHITSLPGRHGIGDIADSALRFIDTLADMCLGVWQFLPTGPTAYGDSPYQPLSAFAGNAMLIGLDPLVRSGLLSETEADSLERFPCGFVEYDRLIPAKRAVLALAAERFSARSRPALQTAYEEFVHRSGSDWLDNYALFRILKTMHGEIAWPKWEKRFVRRDSTALLEVKDTNRKELDRIRFTQFLFDRQWRRLRQYATEQGIRLFGDMPIYIALDSADAWQNREMLLIDPDGLPSHIAGVPPDYFSKDGQLWGNPLYDWDYQARTGYRWWIERMRHAASQSHLVRIDHFRGFEAFWSVPYGADTARSGNWVPGPGDALFEAMYLSLGQLPIVAEDLGLITEEVDELRLRHGFPGMRVLQFEMGDKDFELESIEENSVCYTGTHDNDTTQGWFHGSSNGTLSRKQIRKIRKRALKVTGGTPETIHTDLIRLAFSSSAALAMAPMQDYLGLGSRARMNIPGTTGNNWRWRLLPGQMEPAFLDSVRELVHAGSRTD